jgi:hypothetical protein
MTGMNKRMLLAAAGCILAVASLCIVAAGAGERPTRKRPAAKSRKRPSRRDVALKIGQMAPDFELYTLKHALKMQGKGEPKAKTKTKIKTPTTQPADGKIRLSSFRGKKPVYLIFASYT